MITQSRFQLQTLLLLALIVHPGQPVCVDVPSSEADVVLGMAMKLTCISCMQREEVIAMTHVDWYYLPQKDSNKTQDRILIFQYKNEKTLELEGPWQGRLLWNGSRDLQDVSITILNVTYNDSGTYECQVNRKFKFEYYSPSVTKTKVIKLNVKEKGEANSSFYVIPPWFCVRIGETGDEGKTFYFSPNF
ncbi:sodium channel subunit beta-3-like [Thalassophryne amazonica]|uniref:sodium channel subunit beta-3-like n=1 Tax=Thalassophryne amazonica TaxID=390379 RepID=UPI001471A7D6|nr:sodium channel subunit beta-3-like [Thalassophryne amazonica]